MERQYTSARPAGDTSKAFCEAVRHAATSRLACVPRAADSSVTIGRTLPGKSDMAKHERGGLT